MTPSVKTELLYLAEVLMPICPRPHLERSRVMRHLCDTNWDAKLIRPHF